MNPKKTQSGKRISHKHTHSRAKHTHTHTTWGWAEVETEGSQKSFSVAFVLIRQRKHAAARRLLRKVLKFSKGCVEESIERRRSTHMCLARVCVCNQVFCRWVGVGNEKFSQTLEDTWGTPSRFPSFPFAFFFWFFSFFFRFFRFCFGLSKLRNEFLTFPSTSSAHTPAPLCLCLYGFPLLIIRRIWHPFFYFF